ncbi:MAG: thiamine pyrophosphate-dependent enzyme [Candidatus Poribacteria bacterium]|nr:thiamine pyrophosphate-dependent enzyme [Candidatus Poribacteria bacterium]
MLNKEECLKIIAKHRTDETAITTMGTVIPWAEISDHPLDYASVGSGMGHAADFGLGIALARPDKSVLVLNGDGSMLMCLGTLATITGLEKPARNYYLFVCDNGTYEVTGNQPVPGGKGFSFAAIARGAGFEKCYEFDQPDTLDASLPSILTEEGPVFITLKIAPATEPPPNRRLENPARYLRGTLAESTHELRQALREN